MTYSLINLHKSNGVATVTLNAPPLNIISIAMMSEISAALEDISGDDEIRVIHFTGAGVKAFSAGVEIREHTPQLVEKMLVGFHDIFRGLIKSERVTIASVRGHCLGGGFELAAACDVVVASEGAKFSLPEIKLGCFPPVAAALFPRLVGAKRAEWLMTTGDTIDAHAAWEMGLVTEVVSDAALVSRADEMIATVCDKSAAVITLARHASPDWRAEFLRDLDHAERVYLRDLVRTADMHEGLTAFAEKREPSWRHK